MIKIGVIGYGACGKMLAEQLDSYGEVLVHDLRSPVDRPNASIKSVAVADLVIIAVGLDALKPLCRKIAPLLSPDTVVMDVCSVKLLPAQILKDSFKDNVIVATHPLFGPETVHSNQDSTRGLTMFWCDMGYGLPNLVGELFEDKLKTVMQKIEPQEHDKRMATSHGLTSFLARALVEMNLDKHPIDSFFHSKLLELRDIEAVHSKELFKTMQNGNPYTDDFRHKFIKTLQSIDKQLESELEPSSKTESKGEKKRTKFVAAA